MRILIVYPFLTHPVDAGNKRWLMAQVDTLRRLGQEVYVLCVNVPGLKADMQQNRLERKQTRDFWGDHGFIYNASWGLRIRYSLLMNYRKRCCQGYYRCDDLYPPGLTAFVRRLQRTYRFEACIVNYYWLTKLLKAVPFSQTAINTHDVFAEKDKVLGMKTPWMCTTREEEAKGVQRARYVFALQEVESNYFRALAPEAKVLDVYCAYAVEKLPLCHNHHLVVLAAGGELNRDGLEWFIREVLPVIVRQIPDVMLVVGGGICSLLKHYANHPHVQLIGKVDRPSDLYRMGDVAINPCRKGTGLKVKTFEAMSYGRVCMVHPHSTIGIYKKHQAPVFASDNASEWATFLEHLWGTSSLESRSQESIAYIQEMNCHIASQYSQFLALT